MLRNPPDIFDEWRVFISSTFRDMKDERLAVIDALEQQRVFRPWVAEEDPSQDLTWEEVCKSRIKRTELALFLVGAHAGTHHPQLGRPIVHLEYDWVAERRRGGSKLPGRLIFLRSDVYDAEGRVSQNLDSDQAKFVTQLTDFSAGAAARSFRSTEELARQVSTAVTVWSHQVMRCLQQEGHRLAKRMVWLSRVAVAAGILMGVYSLLCALFNTGGSPPAWLDPILLKDYVEIAAAAIATAGLCVVGFVVR